MRAFHGGFLLVLAAGQALAGAWPREDGTSFVSLNTLVSTGTDGPLRGAADLRHYSNIYAEHGLTPKLTAGFDAAYGVGDGETLVTALGFLRRPVWQSAGGQIVAAEIGIGLREESGEGLQARLRPGIAWGRGFESRWGGGWSGVETSAELRLPSRDVVLKADATVGLKPNDRLMLIAQVQAGRSPGEGGAVNLAPSAVWRIGEAAHLQLGASFGLLGDSGTGAKFGTWFSF